MLIGSAAAFVGLVSGCRTVGDQPSPTTSSTGSAQPTESAIPTIAGPVNEALSAITETRLFVQEVGTEFPGLRPRVTRLVNLHLAHEELLQGLIGSAPSPSSDTPVQVTGTRAEIERDITAAESGLAATLAAPRNHVRGRPVGSRPLEHVGRHLTDRGRRRLAE